MIDITKFIFIDTETVTEYENFDLLKEAKPHLSDLWIKKARERFKNDYPSDISDDDYKLGYESYKDKGGLYAEFAKIVCISWGCFLEDGTKTFIKSHYKKTEAENIIDFNNVLTKFLEKEKDRYIVAHGASHFDIPFLFKRSIINNIPVHNSINLYGQKPWEVKIIDTINVWKNCGYDGASIDMLCELLGVKNPKENTTGSKVFEMYYSGKLDDIAQYCEGDVFSLMHVFERLNKNDVVRI